MKKHTGGKDHNECHFALKNPEVCSDDTTLLKLSDNQNMDSPLLNSKKIQLVDKLKSDTNCESESCLYSSVLVKKKLGRQQANDILKSRFKPKGPFDSDNWLSDSNIDNVLQQNMIKYKKFYAIPYQMIDFAKKQTELATINIPYQLKKYNTIGVVLNTDTSNGKGKHWFAIFIDARHTPYTIEFFNSSGNYPVHQIHTWINKTKREIERSGKEVKDIIVSPNELQKSDTECGVFSLWFILSRVKGVPVSEFKNVNTGPSDEKMLEFRKDLFRHS